MFSSHRRRQRSSLVLIGILALAIALRVGICFFSDLPWYTSDTHTYLRMAEAISAGDPLSSRPNGYPLLIVILRFLVGEGALPQTLIGLNIILSTAVVGLIFVIGRVTTHRDDVALLAALAVAAYPNQLNFVRFLLTEVPTTFLLAAALTAFFLNYRVMSGLLLGVTAIMRTSLAPLGLLVPALAYAFDRSRAHLARSLGGYGLSLLLYFSLLGFGVVAPSSNLGPNLLVATRAYSHKPIDYTTDEFSAEQHRHPARTYLTYAYEHPRAFIAKRLSSLWTLWGPWPGSAYEENSRGPIRKALIGLRFPVLLLALVAVFFRPERLYPWVLLLPALLITVVHMLFFSTSRFTYPAEPFLLLLATLGVMDLATRTNVLGSRD